MGGLPCSAALASKSQKGKMRALGCLEGRQRQATPETHRLEYERMGGDRGQVPQVTVTTWNLPKEKGRRRRGGRALSVNQVHPCRYSAQHEHGPLLALPGRWAQRRGRKTNINSATFNLPEAMGRKGAARPLPLGLLGILCVPAFQVTQVKRFESLQAGVRNLFHILLHQASFTARHLVPEISFHTLPCFINEANVLFMSWGKDLIAVAWRPGTTIPFAIVDNSRYRGTGHSWGCLIQSLNSNAWVSFLVSI